MSNVLTDWRTALVTLLGTTFPAAEILSGEREGLSRDKDRACVFVLPLTPVSADVNNANPRMAIRFWKKLPKIDASLRDAPPDPEPIEQLMLDLAGMLQPKLTSLGVSTLAYFHVDSITPDVNDEYGVEVLLTGWMRNPSETGG